MNKQIDAILPETMAALVRYPWPGNVRELQNFIERAVILSPQSILRAPISELEPFQTLKETNIPINGLAEVERDHILRALEGSNWVIGGRSGCAVRDETNIAGLQNEEASYPSACRSAAGAQRERCDSPELEFQGEITNRLIDDSPLDGNPSVADFRH